MKSASIAVWMNALVAAPVAVSGYAFVPASFHKTHCKTTSSSSLQMVDSQVLMGAGVAAAGLVAGIGLVAFTESQVRSLSDMLCCCHFYTFCLHSLENHMYIPYNHHVTI